MFILVAHFDDPGGRLPDAALPALTLLAGQPECRRLRFAHSTERAGVFVLVAEFDSAGAYRRALAPFDVRTVVVPWLSTARIGDSGVNEVLLRADAGVVVRVEPTVPEPGR